MIILVISTLNLLCSELSLSKLTSRALAAGSETNYICISRIRGFIYINPNIIIANPQVSLHQNRHDIAFNQSFVLLVLKVAFFFFVFSRKLKFFN